MNGTLGNSKPSLPQILIERSSNRRTYSIFTLTRSQNHVYSQTGGAQYGQGVSEDDDLLMVYAEAFERDADPGDFSLIAIVAHERGHQLIARHRPLAKQAEGISLATEEIIASLVGAMVCSDQRNKDSLIAKAAIELIENGDRPEVAVQRVGQLTNLLKGIL